MNEFSPSACTTHLNLDAELVSAARTIKVLTNLSWPKELGPKFLEQWRQGRPELPQINYQGRNFSAERERLMGVMKKADRAHPLGEYIFSTAASFVSAAHMLEGMGTSSFTELSCQLYGRPDTVIHPSAGTIAQAADSLIEGTKDFIDACALSNDDYCVLAQHVADQLNAAAKRVFTGHKVDIVIDPELVSKAAAGATRIRVRGETCFSLNDIPQLINHELLVHTLTSINGREQPYLKSMALSSPRTTVTQEGLALFSEFITNSIDLHRLRRVALRVKAVEQALAGANFIEVFRFFLESGQNESESFFSAMRIFRGGDVAGGICCTKDMVYLKGLMLLHTFLLKAIEAGKVHYPHALFAGRVALSDIMTLEPFFRSGLIAKPRYEPDWVKNRGCIMAFLLYSRIAGRIALDRVTLSDFRE